MARSLGVAQNEPVHEKADTPWTAPGGEPSLTGKPRIGIYVVHGAEVVDRAAPCGVMAVARRLDPELEVFPIGDSGQPVTATGNLPVLPRYSLDQRPSMTAFVISGGIGTRAEVHNERLS